MLGNIKTYWTYWICTGKPDAKGSERKHGLSAEQVPVSAYWELEEPKGPKKNFLGDPQKALRGGIPGDGFGIFTFLQKWLKSSNFQFFRGLESCKTGKPAARQPEKRPTFPEIAPQF